MMGNPHARGRLENEYSLSIAFLVVALIGVTMFVARDRVAASLDSALEARGTSMARSIGAVSSSALLSYNHAALQLAAERASESEDVVYVVIRNKEGEVAGVAGRQFPPGIRERLSVAPEAPQVRERTLESDGRSISVLAIDAPVWIDGSDRPWGSVSVALSRAGSAAALRRLDLAMLVLGLILTLAAVFAVRFTAKRITEPLHELVRGTEAVASGDMSARIRVGGPREIVDLARSFNAMVDRVQDKAREALDFQEALASLNATLEEQVLQRTRALQESESQYKTLVEHSPFPILIVQAGRVKFVNPAFRTLFGVDHDSVLDSNFHLASLFSDDSSGLVSSRLAAWERGLEAGPATVLARDARGQERELELRGSRIEYVGRPAAECLMVDLTETKRLRAHIDQTERLRALGELAGGVAHDFNNLLGAILGRAQLLRRRRLDVDIDRDLEVIEKSALDGRETVRRIQEFSRVRRDREETPVSMAEIVRDSVEITRTRWKDEAESRDVTIRVVDETLDVPPVMGNPSEFREVLTNLILNAVDAMAEGGTLTVRCAAGPDGVVTEVADTGVGIGEEIRAHLFDPFFSTKGTGGTGLGLSVVYGIVQRHGGSIEVDSEPGRGTTFRLRFPLASGSQVAIPAPAGSPAAPAPGQILVIDDETAIAELLRDTLAADGHRVDVAFNGRDGVGMAAQTDYDLVFTDLGMPDLSGWEVASRIRDGKPEQRIVLVTGWGATIDENDAHGRGIAEVIHKPFDIEELRRVTILQLSENS